MTWQFTRRLISSAKSNAAIRFHPLNLVIRTKIIWIIDTIRELFPMTHTEIEGFLNSLLQFWPQLRYVYSEQILQYPDRDSVMRVYRPRFKSIKGVLEL